MTKRQLISAIIKRLGEDGRLGERTVAKYLDMAWTQIIKDVHQKNPAKLNFYAQPYTVAVNQNATTKEYYSTLPAPIIQGMDAQEGVRRIIVKDNESLDFVPLDINPAFIGNTDVGLVMDVVGYRTYEDKVEYYHMREDIKNVTMYLVTTFDNKDMDDTITIPTGKSFELIGMTIELLGGTPYIDPKRRNKNIEMK